MVSVPTLLSALLLSSMLLSLQDSLVHKQQKHRIRERAKVVNKVREILHYVVASRVLPTSDAFLTLILTEGSYHEADDCQMSKAGNQTSQRAMKVHD